jgi:Ca-activated chloride channel family protein
VSALLDFHFLRPGWLLALPVLLLAARLLLRRRLESGRWRRVVDPELAPWLVESGWHGTARYGLAVLVAAWALATVALAGPTWERRPQPVGRGEDALVIVLDLSLSMYAEDVSPSRLLRARLKVADVLAERADGRTALVVYAGDAHVVVPLTDDVRTIRNLLPALEPSIMPVLGSRPEVALARAEALLADAGATAGRILLVTDGIDDPRTAAEALGGRHPVSVLGVGTAEGGPIPLDAVGRAGHLEAGGRTVVVRLNEGALERLADVTGGRYATFTTGEGDLERLRPAPGGEGGTEREREFELWIDAGPWLVLLLLPVAAAAFRRGLVVTLALAVLLPAAEPARAAQDADPEASAFPGDALLTRWFRRAEQRGVDALRAGRPEDALALLDDPRWRATARYRAEDYGAAARLWAGFDDADAHYNRGNALAKAEQLEDAVAAYDAALARDPEHEDARFNRDLITRLLEAERQASQDPEGGEQQESQAGEEESTSTSKSGEEGGGQQQQAEAEAGESGEGEDTGEEGPDEAAQAAAEEGEGRNPQESDALAARRDREREQALEQWLRRVPDDPGALLERKFRYETERRYRRGLQRTPEGGDPW